MQRFFTELKRRNVVRGGLAYLAACWLLVQMLETLFPIFGLSETSIRWLVIALAIGTIPFLVLTWFFEWTSEGIRRDSEIDHEVPALQRRARRFDHVIIVILTLAVGYFVVDKFILRPASDERQNTTALPKPSPGHNTIAVLPFLDLSPNGDQEYFSDGLTEELLNLLARIPQLRVAARTSSFSFKNRDVRIAEIAETLNVAHVLEGSVRRSGDRLRITAQLISAADGYHLWSDTFEETDGDIFQIQEQISASIVEALKVEMLGEFPQVEQTIPEAYNLYLQGNYLERRGSPESMAKAGDFFRQAVAADPDYATAWVALGTTFINQASVGLMDWDDGHKMAREALLKALQADPENAAAYGQLSWLARVYDADLAAAAVYGERALALQPANPTLVGNAAVLVQSLGRLDDAIRLHEHSVAREPVDPRAHYNLGLAYYFAQRLDDAEKSIRNVLTLSPDYAGALYRLGTIMLCKGETEAALAAFEQELDEAFRVKGRALAYYSQERRAEADKALGRLIDGWGDRWPSEVAQVHAYRGELDAAFEWLEKDYAVAGPAGWGEWRLMPLYDNLRDDPRWQRFLEKVGASDQQLAAIPFTATLPPGDDSGR